ncbi:MAG: ATP-binding cassette domain-containing protein [Pirellulaceae bacterium]|nr:ATP-binding cassette domain-containing protein [Pirellulaceae bacterium]
MTESSIKLIELNDVSLHRNRVLILDQLSLSIQLGQHTVILGPNGSGKTSFLKLLMRFFYPSVVDESTGSIEILGQSNWNVWELRQQLGYINMEIDFHFSFGRSGRLTAEEVVLTGFSSIELEVEKSQLTEAMREAAKEALRRCRVDHLHDRCVAHVSTGERRRILLARAIVHRPRALILDEPTSGLDIGARQTLLHQLQEIADGGTTLVLVTHHLEEILPCIENVVLLDHGRASYQGDRKHGLDDATLSKLFKIPIRLHRDANGFLQPMVES